LCALTGVAAPDTLAKLGASIRLQLAGGDPSAVTAAIRRGIVTGTAFPRVTAMPRAELLAAAPIRAVTETNTRANTQARTQTDTHTGARSGTVDVVFAYDARVHDGAFANNGWLQELPDPVTKLTWSNAALISPDTAQRLGAVTGDVLLLRAGGRDIRIPALIVAGHADDAVTLHFGYGRAGGEHVAEHVGTNVYPIWPGFDSYVAHGVSIEKTESDARLVVTQTHWTMEGRDQARSTSLGAYRMAEPRAAPPRAPLTIYDPPRIERSPVQWAMTVDLGTCIGCSACVVACQSENNIPVVGPDDVAKSREMHWIRIDRYEEGTPDNPRIVSQPMLCQHCENAPCEYVCPVEATTHSPDGLNEMIYNRCVGTRFCSNNCPYKVRRFNWFDYNKEISETEELAKNPDVTVRARGVMEKCTFCVQRIREAEIAADRDARALRGSDVVTACQQACPTRAITFGSLTERDSEMMRRREEPRLYGVLDELGTAPRVRYLARVRNPNPALEEGG
jgi:molybdopterin-containing oxidoreductase family iron-sulfur binding subunit